MTVSVISVSENSPIHEVIGLLLTLASALAQVERQSGCVVARVHVDRGYRGHRLDHRRVFISGASVAV